MFSFSSIFSDRHNLRDSPFTCFENLSEFKSVYTLNGRKTKNNSGKVQPQGETHGFQEA